MRLSCPKPEFLLELVSVPEAMSLRRRVAIRFHSKRCPKCSETLSSLKARCEALFAPEPDVTSSLLRVYGRLQRDETLVLKGWKLDESQPARTWNDRLVRDGWLFRGALAAGVLLLVTTIVMSQNAEDAEPPAAGTMAEQIGQGMPFAQIRVEDRNTVRVHYVKPELLQSVEFETTSAR